MLAAAAAMTVFAGCSDNEPEKAVNFPETQDISINIDEIIDITFTAEADWKISIDKPWLVFIDGEANVSQLRGVAGDVTCQITTADITSIFDTETAVIEITMGNKTQALANVTRMPAERWAKMWTVPSGSGPVECEALALEYDDNTYSSFSSVRFTFTANYDWTLQSVPEWMGVAPDMFSGEAGEEFDSHKVNTYAKIADVSYMPFAQEGDIVLTDQNGENPVTFKATYNGMGEEDVVVLNGSKPMSSNRGVSFSEKGYVMSYDYTPVPTENKTAVLSAYAKDQDFAVMTVYEKDMYGTMYWFLNPSWLHVTKNEDGTLTVTVDNNEDVARTAYIVIIPKAMQPENPAAMTQGWFRQNKDKFVASESGPSSYMIVVSQNAAPVSGGFIANWSTTAIECVPFSEYSMFDGMKPSEFRTGLPDDNTYVAELVPPTVNTYNLMVAPLGFDSDWFPIGSTKNLFELVAYSGTWPTEDSFAYASVYKGTKSYPGISYKRSSIDQVASGSMAYLFFYKDETVTSSKPSAALLLIKK